MIRIMRLFLLAFLALEASSAMDLKSGDIILLPLDCRSCDVIASETEGDFSHSGVYVKFQGEDYVLEALSKVRIVSYESFINRVPKNKSAQVVRVKEFSNYEEENLNMMIIQSYFNDFHDLGFDYKYLWDNFDSEGKELLYCSEFVSKLLNPFMLKKFKTSPMDFSKNYDYWYRAFNGDVPQGLPGNSPNELFRSSLVEVLGPINGH